MIDQFISHHPVYYGLSKMTKSLGVIDEKANITDGLMEFANKFNHAPEERVMSFIHPLYVKLQKDSPMGMMKDFNVSEIETNEKVLGTHEFYDKYLSKSLPLVLRHACEDWDMYKIVQKGDVGEKLKPYLGQLIQYTILERSTGKDGKHIGEFV